MAEFFPPTRGESRTERKQWRFYPSVAGAFQNVVDWRKALRQARALPGEEDELSEVDIAENAIRKEAKSLPVLDEVLLSSWEDMDISRVVAFYNPGDLISPQKGDYFVRAKGPTFVGDEIKEGDIIHFRPQSTCEDDEVAAVRLDTAAGKRTFLKKVKVVENSKKVRLISIRSSEKEITVDTGKEFFQIVAVQKGLIRGN